MQAAPIVLAAIPVARMPIPRHLGFRRREDAPGTLGQMPREVGIAGASRGDVGHPHAVVADAEKKKSIRSVIGG
jgi:hypothetical protein